MTAVCPQHGDQPRELLPVRRVRLRAKRYTRWMRALWSKGLAPGEQGLVITHAEVDRILAGKTELARAEADFYREDEEARSLTTGIAECDAHAARDPQWAWLVEAFGLSEAESDMLMLCAAVELDPWLRRICAYLHDDTALTHASRWLAQALFQWPAEVDLGSDSRLARWLLARSSDTAIGAWTVDPYVARWLQDSEALDAALSADLQFGNTAGLCLYPEMLAALENMARTMGRDRRALELALVGPEGSGKATLAAQLCARIGKELISVRAKADAPEHAVRAARQARLRDAVLYWHGGPFATIPEPAPLMLSNGVSGGRPGVLTHTVTLPRLGRDNRIALWSRLAGGAAPEAVAESMLTPGEIVLAAQASAAGPAAVAESCRQSLRSEPGELFAPLPCPYTWDDIVLPDNVRHHLEEFESQARLRGPVLDDWGFHTLTPLSRGVTALFAGPSGTGKTMAAQVIARSLGLELFRVDLAGVINKYIGETEKRLKQVFAACERANVMLFFDEADALFGHRTQVKDAHDRFANIEIDYLLQRMEQFDGIAVLATNRKSDIDRAFLRRLRFIVDFVQPSPEERLSLWKKALKETSPLGEPLLDAIDWTLLASKLNLSGAEIKSAALSAAFLARQAGTRIQMKHLRRAVERELTKQGLILREGDLEA